MVGVRVSDALETRKLPAEVAVIGAGAWGTTLATMFARKGVSVIIWSYSGETAKSINENRENIDFLPGVRIPENVRATVELEKALCFSDLWVLASPSHTVRGILEKASRLAAGEKKILSAVKGLEEKTHFRMEQVVREVLKCKYDYAVLSGPNLAKEVCLGQPTSTVVASGSESFMKELQALLSTDTFRVYTSPDVVGVEIGGSLKNVYAIGAGICDGLGLGDNTKAAFLTRALVEMTRLGVALGARKETFSGLSGIGDLIATSYSRHSRNRGFGEMVGKGGDPEVLLRESKVAVEGVRTTGAVVDWARKHAVETPIAGELARILFQRKPPDKAIKALMTRELKGESVI